MAVRLYFQQTGYIIACGWHWCWQRAGLYLLQWCPGVKVNRTAQFLPVTFSHFHLYCVIKHHASSNLSFDHYDIMNTGLKCGGVSIPAFWTWRTTSDRHVIILNLDLIISRLSWEVAYSTRAIFIVQAAHICPQMDPQLWCPVHLNK